MYKINKKNKFKIVFLIISLFSIAGIFMACSGGKNNLEQSKTTTAISTSSEVKMLRLKKTQNVSANDIKWSIDNSEIAMFYIGKDNNPNKDTIQDDLTTDEQQGFSVKLWGLKAGNTVVHAVYDYDDSYNQDFEIVVGTIDVLPHDTIYTSLYKDNSYDLNCEISENLDERNIVWKVANENILELTKTSNKNVSVRALNEGTTSMIVSCDGLSKNLLIRVAGEDDKQLVAKTKDEGDVLDPNNIQNGIEFVVKAYDKNGNVVEGNSQSPFKILNSNVVSTLGQTSNSISLKAVSNGTTNLTFVTKDSKTLTLTLKVNAGEIKFDKVPDKYLKEGTEMSISMISSGIKTENLIWTTSNDELVSFVDSNNIQQNTIKGQKTVKIKGLKASNDKVTISCGVDGTNTAKSFSFRVASLSIDKNQPTELRASGSGETITATVYGIDDADLRWTQSGNLIRKGNGKVINVTANYGSPTWGVNAYLTCSVINHDEFKVPHHMMIWDIVVKGFADIDRNHETPFTVQTNGYSKDKPLTWSSENIKFSDASSSGLNQLTSKNSTIKIKANEDYKISNNGISKVISVSDGKHTVYYNTKIVEMSFVNISNNNIYVGDTLIVSVNNLGNVSFDCYSSDATRVSVAQKGSNLQAKCISNRTDSTDKKINATIQDKNNPYITAETSFVIHDLLNNYYGYLEKSAIKKLNFAFTDVIIFTSDWDVLSIKRGDNSIKGENVGTAELSINRNGCTEKATFNVFSASIIVDTQGVDPNVGYMASGQTLHLQAKTVGNVPQNFEWISSSQEFSINNMRNSYCDLTCNSVDKPFWKSASDYNTPSSSEITLVIDGRIEAVKKTFEQVLFSYVHTTNSSLQPGDLRNNAHQQDFIVELSTNVFDLSDYKISLFNDYYKYNISVVVSHAFDASNVTSRKITVTNNETVGDFVLRHKDCTLLTLNLVYKKNPAIDFSVSINMKV